MNRLTKAQEFLKASGAFPLNYLNSFDEHNEPWDHNKIVAHFSLRHEFIAKFGFAVITHEVIELLRGYQPLLEIGAGSGYWSYELQQAGIDSIATDSNTGKYYHRFVAGREDGNWKEKYTNVEVLTARRAIMKYPNRNLLTVWPDYDAPWTTGMLRAFEGEYVIYVGEGTGGCTGSEKFHEMLETEYNDIADLTIPQFDGIHDRLTVFKRKAYQKERR